MKAVIMPLITQVVNHTQPKGSVKLLTKTQGWLV